MNALKAQWVVRAGLIPGDEMTEYRKVWSYVSNDYALDGNKRDARYAAMMVEASAYAADLQGGGLNWVNLEYMWM